MRQRVDPATCDQRRHCCNAFRYGQCNTHVRCSGGVPCRVVSCVPPYRWDSCSTTALVDNATAEHSAPCLQGCGAILTRYDALGANGSYLGASLGPERSVGDGRGRYVDYRGGSIYWTRTTGARAISGAARSTWRRAGGPRGPLGYPTTERAVSADRKRWSQDFQRGVVCDSPATTTSAVYGVIWVKWVALRRERGRLGYPVHDGRRGRDHRGRGQTFVGGQLWALSGRPAHAVTGRVLQRWLHDGAETGRWGYPTGDVKVLPDGRQRGTLREGDDHRLTSTAPPGASGPQPPADRPPAGPSRRPGAGRLSRCRRRGRRGRSRPRAPCGRCGRPASRPGRR